MWIRTIILGVAVVGCGDDKSAQPDAATQHADAARGDAAADAAAAPVTVATGTANVRVYFQNADSSVVASTTTDAAGVASAVMAPGGFVTAVNPFGREELYTYAGVQPGDHLAIADHAPAATFTFAVQLPVDPTAGVAEYEVITHDSGGSAASASAPVTLVGKAARTDFLIWTIDGTGNKLSWAAVPDVPVSSGATIDLTAAIFAPVQAQTFTVTDLPAGWNEVHARSSVGLPHGPLGIDSIVLTGTTSMRSGTVETPTGTPNVRAVDLFPAANTYLASPSLYDWGAFEANVTIDLAQRLLVTQTNVPAWDAVHHQVLWGEGASGVAPDLAIVTLDGKRATKTWKWRAVAPHTGAVLALPALPVGDFDYNVGDTEATFETLTLAKVPGGYDGVRAKVFAIAGPQDLIAGPSGAITLEQWPAYE